MVEIGSKYEETKSDLIDRLSDPENMDLLIIELEARKHSCYFCRHHIPDGDRMFELTDYSVVAGHNVESIFYIDEICMGLARNKNSSDRVRV